MKRFILLIASLFIVLTINAQKEANNWYFGDYAGMNFGFGLPIAVTDGQLTTWEGCSSISTSTGALLFYTDGSLVWNKNHLLMPNGTGLMGHKSSTQSGIIVPKPSNPNHYYIFTVDARDNNLQNGLRYTLVDMTLDGGLGDVVTSEKNIPLIAPTCEKVTAVGHSDGYSTWVITHQWGTNAFYAYLVTSSGVNTTPVISNAGDIIQGDMEFSKGYLKSSPDGSKIAIANNTMWTIELFNLNNTSGVISYILKDYNFTGNNGGPYGVEFSPNSKLLYICQWKDGKKVFQYDLLAGTSQQILDSRIIVASVGQNSDPMGALQIGPDNRLYIARWQYAYMSVLISPNTLGMGCNYVADAVHLGGREGAYGLPPFIQSFFTFNAEFYYDTPVCHGDTINFYASLSDDPDSVIWDFGDPASGPDNSSTLVNPKHFFVGTAPMFMVTLQAYISGHNANAFHLVAVHNKPVVDAGADQSIPFLSSTQLEGSVSQGSGKYIIEWEPAAFLDDPASLTPNTIVMEYSTTFELTITDSMGGCMGADEVWVEVTGAPLLVNPQADPSSICIGGMSQLFANASGGSESYVYSWTSAPPGFTSDLADPSVIPLVTTTYYLTVDDSYNIVNGEVEVEVIPLPIPDAGEDQSIPYGTVTYLEGSGSNGTGDYVFIWEPADKLLNPYASSPTTVNLFETTIFSLNIVDLITSCESIEADIVVVTVDGGPLNVTAQAEDPLICDGGGTQLFAYGGGGDTTTPYIYTWTSVPATAGWPTNIQNPPVNPTYTTVYTVEVYDGFFTAFDFTEVQVSYGPATDLGDDVWTCPYDSVTLTANILSTEYEYYWSNGSVEESITIGTTGIGFDIREIWLEITDLDGCMGRDEVTVYFDFARCFGIDEHNDDITIDIYPNPVSDIFNLTVDGVDGILQVVIFNIHGQEMLSYQTFVRKGDVHEKQIDLTAIPKGIYFIKVVNDNNVHLGKFMLK